MALVLDASATVCLFLPGKVDAMAELVRRILAAEQAWVPEIWWFETRNLIIGNERRGRISADQLTSVLEILTDLPVDVDHLADYAVVLAFARRHRLTTYAAAYLELARRKALPLATLDASLIAAARAEQVSLI